jgi:preprotein translocase subunit SecD
VEETVCPGVFVESPSSDSYYLLSHRPAITGSELVAGSARQELDTTTGEPIVVLRFTAAGAELFARLTDALAGRGRRLGEAVDPFQSFQHVALVVDGRIVSWPSIDWQAYPNGISGDHGIQISGIRSLQEARDLALSLQTGALPVELEVVPASSRSG